MSNTCRWCPRTHTTRPPVPPALELGPWLESCARLVEGADHAAYEMVRRMSALLSSVAPGFGEVSLVRSHSVMAARS